TASTRRTAASPSYRLIWQPGTLDEMHGIDAPIVAVIGALVLTGCGASTSKGPPLTHEQFVDRMHSICRPINNMNGKFGDPSFDKHLIDETRHELSQLRSLNPPQAEADALHDAFDHWSSALDDFER